MNVAWTRRILLTIWCAFAGAAAAFPSVLLAQPPAPVRVGGQIREPKNLKRVAPVYPEVAKTAGLEAVIILESTIDERGAVVDIKPLRDVPPLTQAAVDVVKQWRYEPTLLNGVPVPVVMSVTVNFVLGHHIFSISALLTSLQDENEHVRAAAARTLGQLRTSESMKDRAAKALEKVLAEDESARVREAAARSLSQLDGRRLPEVEEPQPLSGATRAFSEDVAVITPERAADYVGRDVVVHGVVAQVGVSEDGDSLFLNLGGTYPLHVFNAVIFKKSLQRFPDAQSWEGKVVKIRGTVQRYKGKGKPEIILEQPQQLTVDSSPALPHGAAQPRVAGGVEGRGLGGEPGPAPGDSATGTGPAMDYDSPPRPIKVTRPQYPQEAFAGKVEGTVLVEILIDSQGRVVRARVLQSIPLLDAAALQTVYHWVFQPAVKDGRPVATIAQAPIAFRIYKGNEAELQRKQRQARSPR
jgi:TonB family protein